MAKKKSKTQKMKKSQKQKQKKIQKKILEQTEALKKIQDSGAKVAPSTKKAVVTPIKKNEPGKKELVSKDKVKYNIAINSKNSKQNNQYNKKNNYNKNNNKKNNNKKKVVKKNKVPKTPNPQAKIKSSDPVKVEKNIKNLNEKKKSKNLIIIILTAIVSFFKLLGTKIKVLIIKIKKNNAKNKASKNLKKLLEEKKYVSLNNRAYNELDEEDDDETNEKELARQRKAAARKEKIKNSNWLVRFLYAIIDNRHIIFNAILIVFFIVLLIGLIKIDTMQKGTIIYISLIAIFLMLVAISYNRYLSGKIFTIILCLIMGYAIYKINYTYDFIRSLNTAVYEAKTYYIVTLDNSLNKSIYNINNKRVGIYNENTTNIERKLNTKLSKVKYVEYDNLNDMFDDFYNQNFRAILVDENEYNYMKNYINKGSRSVKILYEFKANAKK